jgi:hypothetical protein
MDSKIDQEVIDELIAMLEDHIAGGMKPAAPEDAPADEEAEPVAEEIPGVEKSEEDDEDMAALMEMYSKG